MPAESTRLARRIRRRDRVFVALVTGAALVGTPVAIVLADRGSGTPAGCVSVLRPGFMGGQTTTWCGKQAAEVCRSQGAKDSDLGKACRREGLPVGEQG
jgi:hypothetical protein